MADYYQATYPIPKSEIDELKAKFSRDYQIANGILSELEDENRRNHPRKVGKQLTLLKKLVRGQVTAINDINKERKKK